MTTKNITSACVYAQIGSLSDMGTGFAEAWKAADAGQHVARDNVTFLSLDAFMAAMSPKRLELMRHLRRGGAMSVRQLAGELGRDYKSVHREVALLVGAGLVERRARDLVAVGWQRVVTEVDLAA